MIAVWLKGTVMNNKTKLAARIVAGVLAALMVVGTITMTIMYLLGA